MDTLIQVEIFSNLMLPDITFVHWRVLCWETNEKPEQLLPLLCLDTRL